MPEDTPPFRRVSFFNGRLLTAEDLNREQEYTLGKQQLHNRSLHGFGIVDGLEVSSVRDKVVVAPGFALNCEGNEIVVSHQQVLTAPDLNENARSLFVNLRYAEEKSEPVGDQCATDQPDFGVIIETFEVCFEPENCNRAHRHARARWLACGQPHALTIAKLKRHSQGWRVDRGYRPPVVK